jgi:hypothetical protein
MKLAIVDKKLGREFSFTKKRTKGVSILPAFGSFAFKHFGICQVFCPA